MSTLSRILAERKAAGGADAPARAVVALREAARDALEPALEVLRDAMRIGLRDAEGRPARTGPLLVDPGIGKVELSLGYLGEDGAWGLRVDLHYSSGRVTEPRVGMFVSAPGVDGRIPLPLLGHEIPRPASRVPGGWCYWRVPDFEGVAVAVAQAFADHAASHPGAHPPAGEPEPEPEPVPTGWIAR